MGAIGSIIPFIENIEVSKSSISVQFDFFDVDPLPKYPTEERIEEEIQENIKRNKEIKEQHQKDIGKVGAAISGLFMGFPESKSKCRIELRKFKLVELVEMLLSNFLSLDGVIEGSVAIRNIEIRKKNEIIGHGSSEDGVYTCSIDDISDDSEWM